MRSLLILLLLVGIARSDVINGSFENGQFAQPGDSNYLVFAPESSGTLVLPGSTILTGWNVSLSPFDADHSLTYQPPSAFGLEWTNSTIPNTGGSRWIDLNRGNDLWQVSQSFATIPGQVYRLSYIGLAGSQMGGATTLVSLQGSATINFNDVPLAVGPSFWQSFSHDFIADSTSTVLSFAAQTVGNDSFSGTQIDSVSVTAVPEPVTLWCSFGAAIALIVTRYRRYAFKLFHGKAKSHHSWALFFTMVLGSTQICVADFINFDDRPAGFAPSDAYAANGVGFFYGNLSGTIAKQSLVNFDSLIPGLLINTGSFVVSPPNSVSVPSLLALEDTVMVFDRPISSVSLVTDIAVGEFAADTVRLIALRPASSPTEFQVIDFVEEFDNTSTIADNTMTLGIPGGAFYFAFQRTTEGESFDNLSFTAVPEPTALLNLAVFGLLAFVVRYRCPSKQ